MDAVKKRNRMIRKIKKRKFWPAVIRFILYVFLLVAAFELFAAIVMFILFESQAALIQGDINRFREGLYREVEQKTEPDFFGLFSTLEIEGPEKLYLCDKGGETLYSSSGTELPDIGQYSKFFHNSDYEVYYTENPLAALWDAGVMKEFWSDEPEGMAAGLFDASRFSDQEKKAFHVWIKAPVQEGTYLLYIELPIVVMYKDMLYIMFSIVFIFLLAGIPFLLYFISDIREIIGQRRLTRLLYTDTVTMGKNWLYFREKAHKQINKIRLSQKKCAMVCMHVNKYRNFCTCYGTVEGENLQVNIYRILEKQRRGKELFARHSDAEFGLLLSEASAELIEQRISELEKELETAAGGKKIHFSFGLCEITDSRIDEEEYYVCASIARPTDSGEGVSRVAWFTEQMKQERLWELHVEEKMQQALDNGEFQVYVQPKYDPVTEKLVGGEALIRWISPEDGFIGPGKFIPIFEKNSFITKIDNFMVTEVSKLQAGWIAEGKQPVPISINLSRAHFADPALPELVCSLVDAQGVPHNLIELEITESVFFDDKQALLDAIDKLHQMGFEISMDDFGSGYSSLNSLKDLSLDVLKLDGEFFRGEQGKERGDIVIADAIQLAKHLNMKIVAEGVEMKEQVDFLANIGCDMIQGFYFAKPMPAAEFAERLG